MIDGVIKEVSLQVYVSNNQKTAHKEIMDRKKNDPSHHFKYAFITKYSKNVNSFNKPVQKYWDIRKYDPVIAHLPPNRPKFIYKRSENGQI